MEDSNDFNFCMFATLDFQRKQSKKIEYKNYIMA